MSGLKEDEVIFCQYCNVKMKQILLCNTKRPYESKDDFYFQRCRNFICEKCKICEYCEKRTRELEDGLKKHKYGRDDENTESCKWYLQALKSEFNK